MNAFLTGLMRLRRGPWEMLASILIVGAAALIGLVIARPHPELLSQFGIA